MPDAARDNPVRILRGEFLDIGYARPRPSGSGLRSYHVTAHDPGRRSARRISSAAATAVPARTDGVFERPNTQCTHAPRTMANGNPSTAHGTQVGRNAPDSTPRRMTADRIQVPRCKSSRRASSSPALCRDRSSGRSEACRLTILQMASMVLRSAVTESWSAWPASATARSALAMRPGQSDPDCLTPRRTAPEDLSATTCKAFMATTPAAATVCLTVWDVIVDSWGVDSWNVTGACRPNYWTMVSVVSVDTVASEGAPETWGTFGGTAVSAAVRAVDQPPCTARCAPSGAAH